MPKILVVFHSGDDGVEAIADAIAAGAEGVRFSEVEVRRLDGDDQVVSASKSRRQLHTADELAPFDAIVVGSALEGGAVPAQLAALLDAAAASGERAAFADKVGSAFTTTPASTGELAAAAIVARLARLGMILIPPVAGEGGEGAVPERARALGHRVAQVTAWVAHSLGHERGHAHHDGSPRDHEHSPDRGHGHDHAAGHAHEHSHGDGHRH